MDFAVLPGAVPPPLVPYVGDGAATIDSAWIQFTADETSTGATALVLDAADVADAEPFSGRGAVTSLPTTGTPVPWSPTAWTTVGEAGPAQRTPDLASVVQRVVDRADWAPGNAMALMPAETRYEAA